MQEDQKMPFLLAIIGFVILLNIYMLIMRRKKNRNPKKGATSQRESHVRHHEDLVRRLEREQEDAARHVELRNKTLEMYEMVRKQAEAQELEQEEEQALPPSRTKGVPSADGGGCSPQED